MVTTLLLALFLQTHPCDAPEVTSGKQRTGTTLAVTLCTEVVPADLQAIVLYKDGVAQSLTGVSLLTTTPNAAGLRQFRSVIGTLPRGTYTFQAAVVKKIEATDSEPAGVVEGAKSAPFSFVSVDATAPGAPSKVKVVQ